MNALKEYKKYLLLAISFILMTYSLLRRIFQESTVIGFLTVTGIIGTFLVLIGAVLMFFSFRNLVVGKSRQLKEGKSGLVVTGIYSKTRNPIYLSMWITYLGVVLIVKGWDIVIAFLSFWAYIHIRVLEEERELMEKYSREYSDYCYEVNRYLPL